MVTSAIPQRRNEPLAPYTTFGIGGAADYFFEPRDVHELKHACRLAHALCEDVRVLGGGSNLLISDDGVRAAVISMRRFEPRLVEVQGEAVVYVSAGVKLTRLVHRCAEWGLSGLECLAGIPGTVGGAIAMNAGGSAGTIGMRTLWLELMTPDGSLRSVDADEVAWGYRHVKLDRSLVAFAALELQPAPPEEIFERMDAFLGKKSAAQPLSVRSAGCFFRNPAGDYAGRLVDSAGLKGRRVGGAMVSRKHANFLINRGDATAHDVLELVREVRKAVLEQFHVELENEVHCWL